VAASQAEAVTVAEQKVAYWQKVLSDPAVDQVTFRMFDVASVVGAIGDMIMSDTLYSTLVSAVHFGIPLAEVVPWQVNFRLELPSIEEYLAGVLIKPVPVSPEEVEPALGVLDKVLDLIFSPEARPAPPGKAVYGRSRYDESYWDPVAVREFLRSAIYAVAKKGTADAAVREELAALARALGIPEHVAADIYHRLAMVTAARDQSAPTDFAWIGFSRLSGEGGVARVKVRSWTGEEVEVEYGSLLNLIAGAYIGLTCIGLSYIMPVDWAGAGGLRVDPRSLRAVIALLKDALVKSFSSNVTYNALTVANYRDAFEGGRPGGYRTESYAIPVSHAEKIATIAREVVSRLAPGAGAVVRRLYEVAAQEVYSALYKPSGWGREVYRAMAPEELRAAWLEKWAARGLDRAVLERLWDAVKPVADALGLSRTAADLSSIRKRLLRGG
jgi:hypothetical protein